MSVNFRTRFLELAGEHPYAWAAEMGLPKDVVTAVLRGSDEYQPIKRTLRKIADATGKSAQWWLTGEEAEGGTADLDDRSSTLAPVIGTVAAGSSHVDLRKLELAIKAVDTWEKTREMAISAERRPAVIAVLYEFLVKSEGKEAEGIDVVLRALG